MLLTTLGRECVAAFLKIAERHFAMADLTGDALSEGLTEPAPDKAKLAALLDPDAVESLLARVSSISPYVVADVLRKAGLMRSSQGGIAYIDRDLVLAMSSGVADGAGPSEPTVPVHDFNPVSINRDQLVFSASALAANHAALADRFSD